MAKQQNTQSKAMRQAALFRYDRKGLRIRQSLISFLMFKRMENPFNPVMDWRPVQGVHCISHSDSWDRLQLLCDPELD